MGIVDSGWSYDVVIYFMLISAVPAPLPHCCCLRSLPGVKTKPSLLLRSPWSLLFYSHWAKPRLKLKLACTETGLELCREHGQSRPPAPTIHSLTGFTGSFPCCFIFVSFATTFFYHGLQIGSLWARVSPWTFFDPQVFLVVASLHLN